MQSTIPSQTTAAVDHYRVPDFSDAFRFGSWRVFTEGRSKLYKVNDVVWVKRNGTYTKALITKVHYREFHVAYRFLEIYQVRFAVLFEDRWADQIRYVLPSEIRDGYELHAQRLASKIAMGQEYGSIGNG